MQLIALLSHILDGIHLNISLISIFSFGVFNDDFVICHHMTKSSLKTPKEKMEIKEMFK